MADRHDKSWARQKMATIIASAFPPSVTQDDLLVVKDAEGFRVLTLYLSDVRRSLKLARL